MLGHDFGRSPRHFSSFKPIKKGTGKLGRIRQNISLLVCLSEFLMATHIVVLPIGRVTSLLPIITECLRASSSVIGAQARECFFTNSGLHIGVVQPVSVQALSSLGFLKLSRMWPLGDDCQMRTLMSGRELDFFSVQKYRRSPYWLTGVWDLCCNCAGCGAGVSCCCCCGGGWVWL